MGLGGLGSSTSVILAKSGPQHMRIVDDDIVSSINLHRQILYDERDIGRSKAEVAGRKLLNMSPGSEIEIRHVKLDRRNLHLLKARFVLDCTDNLETRFLINAYCTRNKIPWIYTTVAGDHGFARVMVPGGPCLKCFYKQPMESDNSKNIGVLNTAVQMAASIQSEMALRFLRGKIDDKLLSFDVWQNRISRIKVSRNPGCEVCR